MRKWVWISGWAIQPARFKTAAEKALPQDSHIVLPPTPNAVELALKMSPDRIAGYSLGSLLLLCAIDRIPPELEPVALAPFVAFYSEAEMGGRTSQSALRIIETRLKASPERALKLFYRLADLPNEPTDSLPYEMADLIWGLQILQTQQVASQAIEQVLSICPCSDALMDYSASIWNHASNCYKVDATHNYHLLLRTLAALR